MSLKDSIETVAPRLQVSLVIANIQKRRNIQALIATALAMGVTNILIVGQPKLDLDPNSTAGGNIIPVYLRKCLIPAEQPPNDFLHPPPRGKAYVQRFPKWNDCIAYLKQHAIPLAGVEIDARAITVGQLLDHIQSQQQQQQQQQYATLALVMGNEGQGLSAAQMQDCKFLVRLPQYGLGTASYNVYVAAGLVLQRLHQYQTTKTTIISTTMANTE